MTQATRRCVEHINELHDAVLWRVAEDVGAGKVKE